MGRLPFMPLWVGDFLSTTTHLTLEQRGGYMVVLTTMWNAGGSLPNDPVKLARICGVSLKRWEQISPEILEFFHRDGDRLTQKRLAEEYQKQLENVEKKRAAGAKGGLAKSLKNHDPVLANAKADALAEPKQLDSQSESESKPKRRKRGGETQTAHPDLLPVVVEHNAGFDAVIERYPRKDSAAAAKKVYDKIIKKKMATEAEILEGVDRMQRVWGGETDLQYCPMLVNWLRDERWKDQFVQRPKPGGDRRNEDTQQAVDTFQCWAVT